MQQLMLKRLGIGRWILLTMAAACMMISGPSSAIAAGNIAVVNDVGHYIIPNAKIGVGNMQIAASVFYNQLGYEDDFDFLFVFMQTASSLMDSGYLPDAYPISRAPSGTNAPNPSYDPTTFGVTANSRLKVIGDMYATSNYTSDPYSAYVVYNFGVDKEIAAHSQVEMLGRAMMRYWGAYLTLNTGDSSAMLGGNGYWSYFLQTQGSVLGGNMFDTHLGPGEFSALTNNRILSPLDLYLMGLVPPEDVDELYYITGASKHNKTDPPDPGGSYFTGTQVDFTMSDVTAANGTVDMNSAQTDFRCAFILVTPEGSSANAGDLSKLESLRTAFEQWFVNQTDGLATMDCSLDGGGPTDGDSGDPNCATGELRCRTIYTVEECDQNGDWLFKEACTGDFLCEEGVCVDQSNPTDCQAGQARCSPENEDVVERCDGGSWMFGEDCSSSKKYCVNGVCKDDSEPEDGDTVTTDGDVDDGGNGRTGCTSPAECPINHRCTSAGLCEACPNGTELSGNVCFATSDTDGDGSGEDGGSGCQSTSYPVAMMLLLALAVLGLRRRIFGR